MRRLVPVLVFATTAFAAAPPAPSIAVTAAPSPTAETALGGALTTGPDGTVWLSWIEPAPTASSAGSDERRMAANAVRFAKFDASAKTWLPAHTAIASQSVGLDPSDVPQLAIAGDGRMSLVWGDGTGGANFSESSDQGATWTNPAPWTHRSTDVSNFSLVRLADGRVLAAWLDGRAHPDRRTELYARILGEPESADRLVDRSVCDCCPTALVPLLDGGALLTYRGRTADEIRDIRVARFRGSAWEAGRTLNADGWRITGCPVNGPRLSSDGSRGAAAWFTAAQGEPRVLVSYTPDAGARWLTPLRIDRGRPAGYPDVVLLSDGTVLVAWVELDGSVWLRRVAPDFSATEPVPLAVAGTAARRSMPRLWLLRDYGGGTSAASLLIAFTRHRAGTLDTTAAGIAVLVASVPEGKLLAAERDCDCAPTPEELRGFSIRGAVSKISSSGRVEFRHEEVPGVFAAGVDWFQVSPEVQSSLEPGREFLARVERRDGRWWLFDPRMLALPAR